MMQSGKQYNWNMPGARYDFLKMHNSDFRRLGIFPLRNILVVRSICQGKTFVYHAPYELRAFKEKRNDTSFKFVAEVEQTNFLEMTEELFRSLGFSEGMILKYLWLQKFIKGEVDGIYQKDKCKNLIKLNSQYKENHERKNEKIDELKQFLEVEIENAEQRKAETSNVYDGVVVSFSAFPHLQESHIRFCKHILNIIEKE